MELANFLKDQGMPEEDILKCLDGDEEAMQKLVEKSVKGLPSDPVLGNLDKNIQMLRHESACAYILPLKLSPTLTMVLPACQLNQVREVVRPDAKLSAADKMEMALTSAA
eukprot:8843954-Pyramimonas_sp.AAC.1